MRSSPFVAMISRLIFRAADRPNVMSATCPVPCPVGMEELAARLVHALVSVRAEEVALRLEQIGRQASGAIAIVERQRRGERRRGHSALDRRE